MIDITKPSSRYFVRCLEDSDVDDIVELCRQNTVLWEWLDKACSRKKTGLIISPYKLYSEAIQILV